MAADKKSSETVTPEELRELGDAMGCHTQKDIAEVLGITQARVSQILSGKHPVKPGALLRLIRQLQTQHVHAKKRRA
jgi:predicted transcriptional regulator